MRKGYALFDFDGTLIRGDSIVLLCRYARRCGWCGRGQLLRAGLAAIGYALHLRTASQSKQAALSFLAGRTVVEAEAFSRDFCLSVLQPRIRQEGRNALRARKAEGLTTLLVTASPSFYLQPLKAELGLCDVIGTRMDVSEAGVYTGLICGDNCKGMQKPLRLAEYLAAEGDRLDYDASWAYGDSGSDLPMLQLCAQKIAVNPKRKLWKRLAPLEGARRVTWAEPDETAK